jgi:thiamine-monophosphate kinase
VRLKAMIDLSDGLSCDLRHILDASGVGAVLEADCIPIHPDARGSNRPALAHALHDGEDFELCFVVAPGDAERLEQEPPAGVTVVRIGVITAETGLYLKRPDKALEPIPAAGFDHLAEPRP